MKSILSAFILLLCFNLSAQDFFRGNYDKSKSYVLLANPTVANIETVRFLTSNNLLRINNKKVHFVGVYHKDQQYDFIQSINHLRQENIQNIHLHELRKPLAEDQIFQSNDITEEMELLFNQTAGIFFFGGPDIPPSVYGEENTLSVITDPERHYFESSFLFHLLGGYQDEQFTPFLSNNPEYFVTGFCLGLQTMNVATGGTLIQDIPSEVYNVSTPESVINTGKENMHRNYWQEISDDERLMRINFHPIRFTENPFFGKRVKVNKNMTPLTYSSHHQAIEKLGKGLEVTAWSSDEKIVEGITHQQYPHVFSVQFHPEVPALYEKGETFRFSPEDSLQTYYDILDKKSRRFHKKYWKHVSKSLNKAIR